ncbi:MAG: DUF4198 domain-containing protein [Sulfitobacter sp.]
MSVSRFLAVLAFMTPLSATAHEFWIEPVLYQVEPGETLQANFKNGQEFVGSTLSYFDRNSARFDMIADGQRTELSPRAGDSPAFDTPAPLEDGLVVVVHETAPSFVTYREWAKFLKFVKHKDFANAVDDHIAAGWSQERFRERYTRHVKSLMAVGSGKGVDEPVGLVTEIVALTNPYEDTFTNNMKISVLYQGEPRADAKVEVFERAPDDSVTISLHRTDSNGQAEIPVAPGHSYLFDAVVLRPAAQADASENAVVWETFWAGLTFAVPQ